MLENGKDVSYENREDPPASGLVLCAAGRVRKKVELAGWEDYKDHPAQDVYAGEVAAPERIVMTRDGREKNSFDKGTETYEKSYPPWAS